MRRSLLAWCGMVLCLGGLCGIEPVASAAEKGNFTVEKVEYKGWKNNLRLSNGDVELIVTLDVGPRIISYRWRDGKNVFKEYADQLGKTGEKEWQIRGGHRLWVGPEDTTRTYFADNRPVSYKEGEPGVVRFTPPPETEYGIQKEIEVRLAPRGSKVTVLHRLTNTGSAETTLAPWSISVMAPGGVEIIPLPPHHPHPGSPKNAHSAADFAPNLAMVLWPFFDFKDSRWSFGSHYITLRQEKRGPTKIGLAHQMGWIGYLNEGTLFIKRFAYHEKAKYPDRGCNFETFTNEDMLEMESLGALRKVAAGRTVEHTERWELHRDVGAIHDEASIRANVGSKVKTK